MKVRIATRGSDLALWQANYVARLLEEHGAETELIVLKTRGDLIDDVPLHKLEGKAFFTSEIEGALLDGTADLAVHSHKDLPTELTPELGIAAVPPRGPLAERLLIRREAHAPRAAFLPLAHGARVGTSSPRRAEQLKALRPDLEVLDLRGNVPTRVNRLREGRYEAIVLAAAGIDRLELDTSDLVAVTLDVDQLVPAPAQGALALQTRTDDARTTELCRKVFHHEDTARAVAAERSLLALAGGGCSLPLGATVQRAGEHWSAHVFLGANHPRPGAPSRWAADTGDSPQAAVDAAYEKLVAEAPTRSGPLAHLSIALCGSADAGTRLGARLADLGADVHHERVIEFEDVEAPDLAQRVAGLRPGDVIAITSRQAVRRLGRLEKPAGVRVAAVGPATAVELERALLPADVIGTAGARALAEQLDLSLGTRVLFPCAEDAQDELEQVLAQRGVDVERVVLYRTLPIADAVQVEDVDVRVFMSPSSVVATLEQERSHPERRAIRLALGHQTAEQLARHELAAALPDEHELDALPLFERLVHHLARLEPENAQ